MHCKKNKLDLLMENAKKETEDCHTYYSCYYSSDDKKITDTGEKLRDFDIRELDIFHAIKSGRTSGGFIDIYDDTPVSHDKKEKTLRRTDRGPWWQSH